MRVCQPSTPFHTAPLNTVPHGTTPHRSARHHTAPFRTAPHRTIPHGTTPHRSARHHTAPFRTAPHCTVPHGTTLHRSARHHNTQDRTARQHTRSQNNESACGIADAFVVFIFRVSRVFLFRWHARNTFVRTVRLRHDGQHSSYPEDTLVCRRIGICGALVQGSQQSVGYHSRNDGIL